MHIGCTVLQSPNYGSISAILDNPEPGDIVTFTCNDGYNLLGSNLRTCLSTGLWSGEAASCQGKYQCYNMPMNTMAVF